MPKLLEDLLVGLRIPASVAFGVAVVAVPTAFHLGSRVTSLEDRLKDAETKYAQLDKHKDAINLNISHIQSLAQYVGFQLSDKDKFVNRSLSTPNTAIVSYDAPLKREIAVAKDPQDETGQGLKRGLHMATDSQGRVLISAPKGRTLTYKKNPDGTLVIDYK